MAWLIGSPLPIREYLKTTKKLERDPLVSVLCMAYNHAAFIRKTLDGFVEQKVTFPIEVIVHDDASTDDTARIVKEYQAKYPALIKGIYQTDNQKSIGGGRVTRTLYSAAKGRYIALCEGDDHWIDPEKLQRQVDALETDPRASGCFTDAYNEMDGVRTPYMDAGYALSPRNRRIGQKEIIVGQGIPTCTFVGRNVDFERIYQALKTAPVGDTLLFTYLSGLGHFIYQPERTGVRVVHAGGAYSMKSAVRKLDMHLRTLPHMDRLSGYSFSDLLTERRRKIIDLAWSEAITTSNRELARYVWPKIAKERSRYRWNFTTTLRNFFKAYWPLPDRIYARFARS